MPYAILTYNHSMLGVLRVTVVVDEGRHLDDSDDPSMHHTAGLVRALGTVLVTEST